MKNIFLKDGWILMMIGGFFAYLFTVRIHHQNLSNLIAVLTMVSAIFILYRSAKKNHYGYDRWLVGYAFFWLLADTLWLILALRPGIHPEDLLYLELLYTIPAGCLFAMIIHWVASESKRWNLYQLFLDFLAVFFVLIYLFAHPLYAHFLGEQSINMEYFIVVLYTFLALFIFVSAITLYLSSYRRSKSFAFCCIIAGLILYGSTDFLYAYLSLFNLYVPNSFIDILYLIPPILFALGLHKDVHQQKPDQLYHPLTLPDNYGHRKAPYGFMPLILGLFLLGEISFAQFLNALILLSLYYMMSKNIQLSIKNYHLLQEAHITNQNLEITVRDKTKSLKETNETLTYYSYADPLTDLSNRRAFINYMDELTLEKKSPFHLLYMDLNRFKYINDTHGHDVGDRVLQTIAHRFSKDWNTIGSLFRIGGDEFALILEGHYPRKNLEKAAEKLIQSVEIPISIDHYHFYLGISIGIVSYPQDATTRKALMRYGDMTMYQAKDYFIQGSYRFYDSAIKEQIHEKHVMEMLLKQANKQQEFFLVFQPQFEIHHQKLIGFEALLRWNQPNRGIISPAQFIPVAEETGLIIPMGNWVLSEAFKTIKKINQTYGTEFRMSINVSPVQLQDQKFMETLEEKIQYYDIPPAWIDLEVTEGAAFHQGFNVEVFFDTLRKLGIHASLDDFGTGYSSLSYIKRYDIDRLKIARELINGIHQEEGAKEVVRAIILMAKAIGLTTIAEGVEETAQVQLLRDMGCHEIQGFLWGKPVSLPVLEQQFIKPFSCPSSLD